MCYSYPHPSIYLLPCPFTFLPTNILGKYLPNPTYMVTPTYLVAIPTDPKQPKTMRTKKRYCIKLVHTYKGIANKPPMKVF
jgi:hypothetical protein